MVWDERQNVVTLHELWPGTVCLVKVAQVFRKMENRKDGVAKIDGDRQVPTFTDEISKCPDTVVPSDLHARMHARALSPP